MPDSTKILLIILGLIVLFLLLTSFRMAKEDEVLIVERMGRFFRLIQPKTVAFILPLLDRVTDHIQTTPFVKVQKIIILKDNIPEESHIVYRIQIFDPVKYTYQTSNALGLINSRVEFQLNEQELWPDIVNDAVSHAEVLGFKIISMYIE